MSFQMMLKWIKIYHTITISLLLKKNRLRIMTITTAATTCYLLPATTTTTTTTSTIAAAAAAAATPEIKNKLN
jgi:hypothetical protein